MSGADDMRESDFSEAERGRRFDLSKGYSYPCGDCRQTGKVSKITGEPPFEKYEADCPRCGGTARINVSAEQAKREQAEHEAKCEEWRRELRERLAREGEA